MDVVPVIDLKAGAVVHARGGLRDAYRPIATPLSASSRPADVVAGLLRLFPFRRIYVADLDAIERVGDHAATLAQLAAAWPDLEFWVDNGAAEAAAVDAFFSRGSGSLVIGSESQTSVDLLRSLRNDRRVVLSLDFRGDGFLGPAELLHDAGPWPERVIAMTLARVGSAAGPDVARITEIATRAINRRVYAAGGVRGLSDLQQVAAAGAAGALVATALHSGALTSEELERVGES
ncbi:MAG TPA: HisA/HisF-related TIM barrel protein [Acetobacteraceae bacterium]|nr:HisA/HisF-related TIM barrel protein [Acetobacteraceae bacterium]